jgi:hypothetical protein
MRYTHHDCDAAALFARLLMLAAVVYDPAEPKTNELMFMKSEGVLGTNEPEQPRAAM